MKIIIITTLFIGVLVSTFSQNRSIKFIDNSIDKAIVKAQKQTSLFFLILILLGVVHVNGWQQICLRTTLLLIFTMKTSLI
jgi:hypothetical protein